MYSKKFNTIFFNLEPIYLQFTKNTTYSSNLITLNEKTKIPKLSGSILLATIIVGIKKIYMGEYSRNKDSKILNTALPFDETNIGEYFYKNTNFSDASIIFFPIYSSSGPVWITTLNILEELKFKILIENFDLENTDIYIPANINPTKDNKLILGNIPLNVKFRGSLITHEYWEKNEDFIGIINRIVIITEENFHSLIVNNLFAQSSIVIDDRTWEVQKIDKQKPESIPKITFFKSELQIDDFEEKHFLLARDKDFKEIFSLKIWKGTIDAIIAGLKTLEYVKPGDPSLSALQIKLFTLDSL